MPYEPPRSMSVEEFRRLHGLETSPKSWRADLQHTRDVMNKTEARYALYLDALLAAKQIACYLFEPYRLRLADLTFFKVDFSVREIVPDDQGRDIRLVDVKGTLSKTQKPLVKDDAQVKIKIAAKEFRELHPNWKFQQVWWTRDGWVHKDFVSRY